MKRILIAEDEESLRVLLAIVLTDRGYDVCEAADGDEALQQFEVFRPDLAILDARMPGKTAPEILEILRRRDALRTPVIVMTAFRDEDSSWTDLERICRVVDKPFDVEALVAMVDQSLQTEAA